MLAEASGRDLDLLRRAMREGHVEGDSSQTGRAPIGPAARAGRQEDAVDDEHGVQRAGDLICRTHPRGASRTTSNAASWNLVPPAVCAPSRKGSTARAAGRRRSPGRRPGEDDARACTARPGGRGSRRCPPGTRRRRLGEGLGEAVGEHRLAGTVEPVDRTMMRPCWITAAAHVIAQLAPQRRGRRDGKAHGIQPTAVSARRLSVLAPGQRSPLSPAELVWRYIHGRHDGLSGSPGPRR